MWTVGVVKSHWVLLLDKLETSMCIIFFIIILRTETSLQLGLQKENPKLPQVKYKEIQDSILSLQYY